jgi:hypothetical protein
VSTLIGPGAGLSADFARLTFGNSRQMFEGEETGFASEAARFLRRYTPGSNLWYFRLAWDRLLMDQLQAMVDRRMAAQL